MISVSAETVEISFVCLNNQVFIDSMNRAKSDDSGIASLDDLAGKKARRTQLQAT